MTINCLIIVLAIKGLLLIAISPNKKESMKKEFITNKENCTDNIYYMQDEENKIISIDTYSMELEAKHKLKKLFPNYKIESVYIT